MSALPDDLRLGAVHLTVADLDRSVAWYGKSLGLRPHAQEAGRAALGDGEETVLVLHEDAQARPPGRTAGLFHYALLYPSREELARAAVRIVATQTPIQGASDHGTHEALYLADVDGNGIELAADRPRDRWPKPQEIYAQGPRPLDTGDLLATVADEEPSPKVAGGLRVGHLHLHVGDIREALEFYGEAVGFDLMANIGSAAFVSAGGYHHHLGMNVWNGRNVPPPPEHSVGLRHWTVELQSSEDVAELRERLEGAGVAAETHDGGFLVRDPWRTALLITTI